MGKKRIGIAAKYPWLTIPQLRILRDGGSFDTEGMLHNADGCVRCTSMVKASGKRCKNFAILGSTFCHIHGGTRALAKAGRERLYSSFIESAKIKDMYESQPDDDTLPGIREELGLLRALLAQAVSKAEDFNVKELKDVAKIVGEIRNLVNDCTKAEIHLGQLIDIGKVVLVVKALAEIVQRYIKDEEVLKKIATDFDKVLWPAPLASTPRPNRTRPTTDIRRLAGEVR